MDIVTEIRGKNELILVLQNKEMKFGIQGKWLKFWVHVNTDVNLIHQCLQVKTDTLKTIKCPKLPQEGDRDTRNRKM